MRFVVLGAGVQGRAIAYDLARAGGVREVVVADRSPAAVAAARAAAKGGPAAVTGIALDIRDRDALDTVLRGASGVVGAVSYDWNVELARAAIRARAHFCDLGGNNDVVARELELDGEAREAGVSVIPDCGLAPGMASMLVAEGMRRLDRVDSVAIRVGGLPRTPIEPLGYQMAFSVRGLVNEYVEPARRLRDGRIETVPSLTEIESLRFPAPYDELEAFNTSGGCSTLPETYRDRLRNLDYKTIRYPGHCAAMKAILDLGLFDDAPASVGDARVSPRDVFEAVAPARLPKGEPDVVLVRVTFATEPGAEPALTFEMIDREDERTGFTAMARTTGFPAAVAIWLAARGEVSSRGALPQERCLDPRRFLEELRGRGLPIEERTRG